MAIKFHSILVVDDEEANRDMLSRRLIRDGYIASTADSGLRALEMLRAERFDLVLLDLMMPEMDGFETLDRIRSDPALAGIPVIMVTALNDREAVLHCIKNGAQDYIVKPFDMVTVKARIWRVLQGQAPAVSGAELANAGVAEGANVLLVEDEPVQSELCLSHLNQLGCQTTACSTAAEARSQLAAAAFDLILLDLKLPDCSGMELLKEIRADQRHHDVPVLIASVMDDPDIAAECLRLGAIDYLQKPFHAAQFSARLLASLQVKRARDAEKIRHARLHKLSDEGKEAGVQDAGRPKQ